MIVCCKLKEVNRFQVVKLLKMIFLLPLSTNFAFEVCFLGTFYPQSCLHPMWETPYDGREIVFVSHVLFAF